MPPAKLLVIDNEQITVWIYPERKLIHHVMKTYCHGPPLRDALTLGTAAMEQHRATKWLSDDRANSALVPEDMEWSRAHWFPRTRAAGWRHWAIIQPQKLIGQVNITRFSKQYAELGINAKIFSDPDEAARWIDEQ